ncbi:hypothetical protein AVEN_188078-1 [Araneus ventricosus]|uniref:Uncharacterized protein n=1 Tax=Araneus ventricosus TaxID=182803 RepID=A0A4Y2IDS3_ARAVE|nr:hypothetical protein AVEN_188078-1 [Araneus ventricosus]
MFTVIAHGRKFCHRHSGSEALLAVTRLINSRASHAEKRSVGRLACRSIGRALTGKLICLQGPGAALGNGRKPARLWSVGLLQRIRGIGGFRWSVVTDRN